VVLLSVLGLCVAGVLGYAERKLTAWR